MKQTQNKLRREVRNMLSHHASMIGVGLRSIQFQNFLMILERLFQLFQFLKGVCTSVDGLDVGWLKVNSLTAILDSFIILFLKGTQ